MFKKAERKKIKLKIAITGPTGSGKTYSALRLAKGLGEKIAVIDTENGSASLYSDSFNFDVLDVQPPFTTEKYIEAINAAEKAGYDVIIIDSLSHAWEGEGGLLEQKAVLDARPGTNHWTNWAPITKKDLALKNAYLHSSCHVIATMRSKMEYAQTDDNGKKKIQKLGMAPIQRDGVTYDFTIVFDVAMDHKVEASKDRTGIFTDKIFAITEETGVTINKWIEGGAEVKKEVITTNVVKPSETNEEQHPSQIFSEEEMMDDIVEIAKQPSRYQIDCGGPALEGRFLDELTKQQQQNIYAFLVKKEVKSEKETKLFEQTKKALGFK